MCSRDVRSAISNTLIRFEKFSCDYFIIRLKYTRCSGICGNICIEQTLMRSIKTEEGLLSGRRITDDIILKWKSSAHVCSIVIESAENFTDVRIPTEEHHIELKDTMIVGDNVDRYKTFSWFEQRSLFHERAEDLVCMATVPVAASIITCYLTLQKGQNLVKKTIGQNFEMLSIPEKRKVIPIAYLSFNSYKG